MSAANIAVLGCGYWGQNLVRNFAALGVLRAVADPHADARLRARELAPGAHIEAHFETVLRNPDVDAVAIATPAETHERLALMAFEAGKDVLVEKPMALTVVEGLRMQDLARRKERILMVGHLLEFHPAVLRLRELVSEGVFGRLNYIYSNRLNFGKVRSEENALWSLAPHDIAVIVRLVGELPVEVSCTGGSYVTPGLADIAVASLLFRSGMRAYITVSWLNPFKEQKLVVVGACRMGVFNDGSREEKLVLFDQRVDIDNGRPVLRKGPMEVVAIGQDEPLRRECEHFLDCVRTRREPLTNAASGIGVLRVLQACQASLGAGGRSEHLL